MTGQTLQTKSRDETGALAERLGSLLQAHDLLCLIGDLGAGKTTFAQGVACGLGVPAEDPVRSPTFTLLAEHPDGRLPLYHFDVYRLESVSDLAHLAFDEYLEAGGVVVIEWADQIVEALPQDYLEIRFSPGEEPDCRRITFVPRGERAKIIVQELCLFS
jgi:tRNA threonylcarbamoyladenosine biosynthesis protein TsaE